jgi:hypothetical protein
VAGRFAELFFFAVPKVLQRTFLNKPLRRSLGKLPASCFLGPGALEVGILGPDFGIFVRTGKIILSRFLGVKTKAPPKHLKDLKSQPLLTSRSKVDKRLQERDNGSKNEPLMVPRRAFCGSNLVESELKS